MLKKILGLIAILIITVVAVINVSVDMKNNGMSGMSDLSIANVEALAIQEASNSIVCYSAYRITLNDPDVKESLWVITTCNGCDEVNCYEYDNGCKGNCTPKPDGFILTGDW